MILFVRLIFLLKFLRQFSILLNSKGSDFCISTSSIIFKGFDFSLIRSADWAELRFFFGIFKPLGILKEFYLGFDAERDKIVSSSPTLQSSSSSERSEYFSFALGVVIEFTGFMMNHSSSALSFSMLTLLSIKASSSALISWGAAGKLIAFWYRWPSFYCSASAFVSMR